MKWRTDNSTTYSPPSTYTMSSWRCEPFSTPTTLPVTVTCEFGNDLYHTSTTSDVIARWGVEDYYTRRVTVNYCGENITVASGGYEWASVTQRKSPAERLREIILGRNAPGVIRNAGRNVLPHTNDEREHRARETLRRVIGEDRFSRFLRDGFISVRGKDGFNYQIFPGHGITCVFDKGKMVERLCVVLNGSFPPTDSMIMRYLMILNNPAQFRSFAIKHNTWQRKPAVIQQFAQPQKTLAEIYQEILKKAA